MVCHCKPSVDGSLGCRSHCLNRMLNIECVQGACPCGDLCSNRQFQKRQYAKLRRFNCGKKGYGLQVLEDISEGQFLIEYVGEVLDLHSYEARQKDYAAKGHKHFYFMTLNTNEVIDASVKGNLGRFVNHSCDPNCRTEKWVVNGEVCVGLFALRSIKKGEELTFDYNYVRVFGAAAKKCHCGSVKCRGYIGGDPNSVDIIVQEDSDEEYLEPVADHENGEIDLGRKDVRRKFSSKNVELAASLSKSNEGNSKIVVEAGGLINKIDSLDKNGQLQTVSGEDAIDVTHESTECSTGLLAENLRTEPVSAVQNQTLRAEHTLSTLTSPPNSELVHLENAILNSSSALVDSSNIVSQVDVEGVLPQAGLCPRMKISRPSKSAKNRKSSSSAAVGKGLSTTQRPNILSNKPRRLLEVSANGHFEAVEEKLNELLDAEGGICKKKDASKGYLKLLLLTAASGDSGNGGAIQSNRDLSMILDAMLKTKSRGVLLDVINKNGLQMLHNMMKLYRLDFKKIPILRKLLKVLEYLAEREILTVERINGDSLHPGVESLRESILSFTEHDDIKVHQIARNFRDRWICNPRSYFRMDKNDRRREFHRGSNSSRYFGTCHHWQEQRAKVEPIACFDQSGTLNNPTDVKKQEASFPQLIDSQSIINRPRKRKSRWDQPASPRKIRRNLEVESGGPMDTREEEKDCSAAPIVSEHRDDDVMHDADDDDDAPPGFDDTPPGFAPSICPSPAVGLPQEKFNPQLPVAYGLPYPMVKNVGTLKSGAHDTWAVAPAMPFQPFPPLPSCPRSMGDQEEARNVNDQGMPCTSGASEYAAPTATNHNMLHRERGPRHFPSNRYHHNRPRNWNQNSRRPWFRNFDGWAHPRNRTFDSNMEMVDNEINNQHLADVNQSVEYAGNS
ncbi:unnamed protein product [Amaranthus hypochondriacus]